MADFILPCSQLLTLIVLEGGGRVLSHISVLTYLLVKNYFELNLGFFSLQLAVSNSFINAVLLLCEHGHLSLNFTSRGSTCIVIFLYKKKTDNIIVGKKTRILHLTYLLKLADTNPSFSSEAGSDH